jgi:phage-related protein
MAEPYFTWKGTSSETKNIIVDRYPTMVKPRMRTEAVTIPGKSGTLTLKESDYAYDPIKLKVECSVETTAAAMVAAGWLQGSGTLILGNESDRSYRARVDEEVVFEQMERGQEPRSFSVTFDCQPYRYLNPAASDIEITTSPTTANNPDNAASEPLIKVEGSGDVVLTIGTQIIELDGLTDGIILDCEMQDAFNLAKTALMNEAVTGDFPKLDPGANVITFTGTVSKITITPRWRCL